MEILREIRRSGFSFQRLSGIYSELNQMKGVPQNPVYHSEGDVFRHTEMVCDCLLALPEWSELEQEEQELLFLAAAFHDIGKVFCTKQEDGNWHIMLKNISDADAKLIAARPEVKVVSSYGTLNYQLDKGYQIAGKDTVICGSDASFLDEIYANAISEGTFPKTSQEVLVSGNVKKELGLSIGSPLAIQHHGTESVYTISGFADDLPMILSKDIYGVFMNPAAFHAFYPDVTDGSDSYDDNRCFL